MSETVIHSPAVPVTEIPILDYDNYEHARNENEAFLAMVRSTLANKSAGPFGLRERFGVSHESPEISGSESQGAIDFLRQIDPGWILEVTGDEELDVHLHDKVVGKYSVKMEQLPGLEALPIIHIKVIFEAEMGAGKKVVHHEAHVDAKLTTIWQKTVEEDMVDNRINRYVLYIERRTGHYLVHVLNAENGATTSWYNEYPEELLQSFIGDCANVLLERLFAANEALPDGFSLFMINRQGRIHMVEYSKLPKRMIMLRPYRVDCFGYRATHRSAGTTAWFDSYFLNRRIVYKEIPGSEAVMKSDSVPFFQILESIPSIKTQKIPSEDMQTNWFVGLQKQEQMRLAELKYANTVGRYPQLTEPLQQMVHMVLVYRPDDVFGFVRKIFQKWGTVFKRLPGEETETRKGSEKTDGENETTENDFTKLLKAYQI